MVASFQLELRASEVNRALATRNRLVDAVRQTASLGAALRNSARNPENFELQKCLGIEGYTDACTPWTTDGGGNKVPIRFDLTLYGAMLEFDPGSSALLGAGQISLPISQRTVAGQTHLYSLGNSATPCSDPGPYCALAVFTSFTAQCPPLQTPFGSPVLLPDAITPQDTCNRADLFEVFYQIEIYRPDGRPVPAIFQLKPVTGSTVVNLKEILGDISWWSVN
jgi:hypothetical protein